ncbi:MAG TPA: SDR family NAD(P)-dependent oxidoreductase [Candidatus Dormibacteraeota bacterium]|nr:SDR family NAD(P)-dependent oxidoreductase [Candidatus Dormibacteraeota bacterium]
MSGRLAGKIAAITGTAGGQGRAAALLFAAEGACIAGCDLKAEEARETAAMVTAAGGKMVTSQPLDLTEEAAVKAWLDGVAAHFGRLDVLYNNAGTALFDPLEQESYEDWQATLRNEVDLIFLACKHAWPHLRAAGGGSVINTASTAAVAGSMTLMRVAHTAGKGAVLALTRQLAAEGAAHGIRANCISPGMIMSPATADVIFGDPEHALHSIRDHIPLRRIGTPEDVARLALYLASDESSYMTGANLMLDGGWSCVLPGPWATP